MAEVVGVWRRSWSYVSRPSNVLTFFCVVDDDEKKKFFSLRSSLTSL